uniref:Uncharacterized protein n=1 Tax=Kalanchoe fedtschenkoi TaxID=63787 RepID=A0A7N0U8K7_KALFE
MKVVMTTTSLLLHPLNRNTSSSNLIASPSTTTTTSCSYNYPLISSSPHISTLNSPIRKPFTAAAYCPKNPTVKIRFFFLLRC